MAKTSTLFNDFSAALSPTFATSAGSPSVSGGTLSLANGDSIVSSATDWDLSASALTVVLLDATQSGNLFFTFDRGASARPTLRWNGSAWLAGFVSAMPTGSANYGNFGGTSSGLKYARMRESAGDIIYEESSDGSAWSTIYTASGVFGSVTSGTIYLAKENAGTAQIDQIGMASAASPAIPAFGRYGVRGPIR